MNIEETQKAYKSNLDAYYAIDTAAQGRAKTEDEIKKQKELLTSLEGQKTEIDNAKKAADFKAWSEQPDGAQLAANYGREAAPGEGTLDDKHVEVNKKTGEMAAKSFFGEDAIKTFKSDEYMEAFDQYLRHGDHVDSKNAKILNKVIAASGQAGLKGNAMKVLNEGSFTSGEAWLPPDFRNQLVERLAAPNSIRQNAFVTTTGTDVVTFPVANYTGDNSDDPNAIIYPVGTRGTWESSSALSKDQSEATNPLAANLRIPVNLYTLPIIVTRAQAEDNSFDLFGWITKKITEVALLDQEKAYTLGDGAGVPWGFTQHPTFSTAVGSTTTVGGFTYTGGQIKNGDSDFLKWPISPDSLDPTTYGILGVEANLPIQYEMGAKWFANKKTYGAIAGMTDTAGRPLWYGNGPQGNIYPQFVGGVPSDLRGYPVVKSVFVDDVSHAKTPLFLGNMNSYYIVDRIGVTVEVFRETYAARDQVLIYLRMRTGGQLVDYYKMRCLYMGV